MTEKMVLKTVFLPKDLLQAMDHAIHEGKYENRSQLVRIAVRKLLSNKMIPIADKR